MTALSSAAPGAYTVKWNVCTGESLTLTHRLGFRTGMPLLVVNTGHGGVLVQIRGRTFALSRDVAYRIKV